MMNVNLDTSTKNGAVLSVAIIWEVNHVTLH